jgi:hypothetical protein
MPTGESGGGAILHRFLGKLDGISGNTVRLSHSYSYINRRKKRTNGESTFGYFLLSRKRREVLPLLTTMRLDGIIFGKTGDCRRRVFLQIQRVSPAAWVSKPAG